MQLRLTILPSGNFLNVYFVYFNTCFFSRSFVYVIYVGVRVCVYFVFLFVCLCDFEIHWNEIEFFLMDCIFLSEFSPCRHTVSGIVSAQ